jgi:hypothetical protein
MDELAKAMSRPCCGGSAASPATTTQWAACKAIAIERSVQYIECLKKRVEDLQKHAERGVEADREYECTAR